MLDLHAHILPGIDDGPRNLEDAIALVRAMAEDGIEHVVATPHIYPGVFDNTPARIADAFDLLQRSVAELDVSLTMSWAAEVRICPEVLDWLEQRRLPLLNGSLVGPGTVLIELPDGQIPVGTDRLTSLLQDRGITPLIAHPERNKAVMESTARLEGLRRSGCKFQLTAGSLLGEFGTRAQTTARALLDAGWVDVVATDAHNRSSRRPRLRAARDWLTEKYDESLATRLTRTQPMEIAGIDSFSLQGGKERLVFRDLPHHMQTGTQPDPAWGASLQLDEALTRADPADSPSTDSAGWSLTDFRIDSVLDELNQASLQAGALGEAWNAPAPPEVSGTVDEDWSLPAFAFGRPSPAAPAARPAPAPAPVPAPTPTARPAPAASRPVTAVPPMAQAPRRQADAPVTPVKAPAPDVVAERSWRSAPKPAPRVEPLMPVWRPEPPSAPPVTAPSRPAQVLTLPVSSVIPTLTSAVLEAETVVSVPAAAAAKAPLAAPPAPVSEPLRARPSEPVARQDMQAPPRLAPVAAPDPAPLIAAAPAASAAVTPASLQAPKGLRLSELPDRILSRDRPGADAGATLKTGTELPTAPRVTTHSARMAVSPPLRTRITTPPPAETGHQIASQGRGQPQVQAPFSLESLTSVSTRLVPPPPEVQGADLGNGLRGFKLSDLPPLPPSKRN